MIGPTAPKRWRLAVDVLAFLTAFALFLSGWALYTRIKDTDEMKARNARIWHAVVCDIERKIVVNSRIQEHSLTHAQLRDYLDFYDNLLVKDAGAEPCNIKITRR